MTADILVCRTQARDTLEQGGGEHAPESEFDTSRQFQRHLQAVFDLLRGIEQEVDLVLLWKHKKTPKGATSLILTRKMLNPQVHSCPRHQFTSYRLVS